VDHQRHNVAKQDINIDARFSCRLNTLDNTTERQLGREVTPGQQEANPSRSYSNIHNRRGVYGLDFHSFDLIQQGVRGGGRCTAAIYLDSKTIAFLSTE
jgi:hypothetical protein